MAPESDTSADSHPSSEVHISVSNRKCMYYPSAAWVLVSMTSLLYTIVDVYRYFVGAVVTAPGLFHGERRAFDMIELRGDSYLYVVVALLILDEFGPLCRLYPDVFKYALRALTNNITLNALAKILSLHYGPIHCKDGADLFEAVLGQIDREAQARARELVKQIFRPLVAPAVLACVQSLRNKSSPSESTAPSPTVSFTFSFRCLPAETSAKSYAHLVPALLDPSSASMQYPHDLSGAPSSSMKTSQAFGHGHGQARSLKRRREEEELQADETEVSHILLSKGTSTEASTSAENTVGEPSAPREPPFKRQRFGDYPVRRGESVSSKRSRKERKERKERRKEGRAKRNKQIAKPASIVERVCQVLESLSSDRLAFDYVYFGPGIYGNTIDTAVGQELVRYFLVAALTDVWADDGMSSHAAAKAIDAMVSKEAVGRIARALGMVEHVNFFQAVARASREISFEDLRHAVLNIYRDVAPVAIECVRPLYVWFKPDSLEPMREHLRDVLLIRNAGYTYRSNLTPMDAVLSTNVAVIEQMFHESVVGGPSVL
ncbi:hypothetical protein GGF50DRAFT_46873 [Schizophyllum commune]